jgi:hypothetical protein
MTNAKNFTGEYLEIEDDDFTDPDTLLSLSSIVENLCVYGPRISDVQCELYRRHAPAGHAADYLRRFWAPLGVT